jgi:hypothetical protein
LHFAQKTVLIVSILVGWVVGWLVGWLPVLIHSEDGNCNVCQNGKCSIFDAAHTQKPKLYIELHQQKPKNKNCMLCNEVNDLILLLHSLEGRIKKH